MMKPRVPTKPSQQLIGYGNVLDEVVALIESARRAAARSVNAVMTAVAKYALEGLGSKVLAAEYRTTLPKEKLLLRTLVDERRALEERTQRRSTSRR